MQLWLEIIKLIKALYVFNYNNLENLPDNYLKVTSSEKLKTSLGSEVV